MDDNSKVDMDLEFLNSLPTVEERINAIALDLKKFRKRFKNISPWDLAEALEIDFDDHANWSHASWGHKIKINDGDFEYPYAENIHYLENNLSKERFATIKAKALQIIDQAEGTAGKDDAFLNLTKEEKEIIENQYARENSSDALQTASLSLEASDGTSVDFQIVIGDGGDIEDAWGPYQLIKGKGFDSDKFILIEDGF